jgi:hypothetical protein
MLDFRAFARCHDRQTSASQCAADICKILQHRRILGRNLRFSGRQIGNPILKIALCTATV